MIEVPVTATPEVAGGTPAAGLERASVRESSDLTASSSRDRRPSLLARALLGLLALYRATAVMRTPRCRFAPSCSSYAVESITTHGALRGGRDAILRILRCHPWNPGGYDPVKPRT